MKQLKFLSVVLAAGALVSCGNNGGSGLKMGDVIGMQQTWTGTREYSSSSSSSESRDLSAYDDWTEESLKKENQQILKDFLNDLDEGKEKEVRRADPEPEISVANGYAKLRMAQRPCGLNLILSARTQTPAPIHTATVNSASNSAVNEVW